ncbi:MAG: LUD domain-containing protein [Bacteroidia bacterium]
MSETAFYETFLKETASRINDVELHGHIDHARRNYRRAFGEALQQFTDLEAARRRAAHIRWKSINDLEKYLIQFESTFIKSGGKVVWARNAAEACAEITAIIQKAQAKGVVKSKSLTADEIGLGDALKQAGIDWTETDLGQFILQLAEEEPSHMVMPALHKSPEEVRYLFNKVGIQTDSAQAIELSLRAADHIREKYLRPDVGITGANFLLADEGAVAITENEGNVMLAASRAKIHIVLAGIDKILPSVKDLQTMWPLLATYGTGQKVTSYNSILWGPRKADEVDGPDQMYVVLIDNGRTDVIADEVQRSVMSCIRCGACQYADPVYSVIGGQTYHSTRMGPPATVVEPVLHGMKSHGFFSELSTLSGADTEQCPVNINFNKLLLDNRRKKAEQENTLSTERIFFTLWKNAMIKRDSPKWKTLKPRRYFMDELFFKSHNGLRSMREPARESFNDLWKKRFPH